MKTRFFFIPIVVLLSACECEQNIQGIVYDQATGIELQNVKVWSSNQTKHVVSTDSFGYGLFALDCHSKAWFSCPEIKLNFKKKGYKSKSVNVKPNTKDTLFIKLEKDFDLSIVRRQILDTVNEIERVNFVSYGGVGYAGEIPQSWYTRKWLIENASLEELLVLINYPNAVIRATAFEGLYRKGYPELYTILMDVLENRNELLDFRSGCENETIQLAAYCYIYVLQYGLHSENPVPPHPFRKINFTSEQQATVVKKLNHKK